MVNKIRYGEVQKTHSDGLSINQIIKTKLLLRNLIIRRIMTVWKVNFVKRKKIEKMLFKSLNSPLC